ncbi:hypothetical protein GCM10027436_54660 [Actinophytocola sediminis]
MVATTDPTNPEVFRSRLRRAVRSWRFWVGAAVVAGLVAGWGLNFYNYAVSEANDALVARLVKDKDSLTEQLEEASSARESLRGQLVSRTTERDRLAAAEATLDQRTSAVKQREDAVKQREGAVTMQERTIAQNTIGEGDWAVGVDVQPGTYRTIQAVSGDCYWEINSDANGDDIVANNIVTGGRPTVTLENGQYFSTSRCGDWRKV